MNPSKKKIVGAFLGTIVEYYDYSLYGFSAGVIAQKFFPNEDILNSLSAVFGLYAIAYLSKPLGSVIFGMLGDTYGRKTSLNITILGIAIPTSIIGFLPEYSEIGEISITILMISRFLQGIFAAGEYDGAAIYVMEHFGKKYHYTASAITRSTGVLGLLLGIGMTNLFNSHIFPEWCWRIPFIMSLPLGIITLIVRRNFDETPDFEEEYSKKINKISFLNLIIKQWKNLLKVVILSGGFGVTYQVSIIFMKEYLPMVLPQSSMIITTLSIAMVMCFGLAMPIAGILSDKFGKKPIIGVSLLFTLTASIGLAISIKYQILNFALCSCVILATSVAPYNAISHGVFIKSFPVIERYRAVGIGHTTGSLIMSGSANYICLLLIKKTGFTLFPVLYISIFAILYYYVISIMND